MIKPLKAITDLPSQLISGLQSELGNVSQADVLRFYATSQTVYSIVNTRAENVAMPIMRVVDQDGKPLPGHPLSPVFSKRSNYQEVMKRIEFSMSLTGHALMVPNPNLIGMFDGMHSLIALSPRLYTRDGDTYRGLRGFFITPNAFVRENYLTPDDALYLYGISPFNEFDGTSPAEVAANAAGTQKELFDTQWSYFQNRMIDGQFVQPAAQAAPMSVSPITDIIAQQLQKALARFGIGSKNAGRTTVVQDRWEVVNLQADFAELAMKELNENARIAICEAFQFPPELLTFKDSNYAQSKEAVAFWRESWLKPRTQWYARQFSNFFTAWYGKPIYIEPDFSGLDEEDDAAKIDRAQKRAQAMFIDLHTAALDAGVKQPDDLLKGMYLVGGVPIPVSELRNYWKYAKLIAPSVFNSELLTGVPLPQPVDPTQVIPTDTGGEPVADAGTQAAAAGQVPGVPAAPVDPTKSLGEPLFVSLSLAGNTLIAGLQRQLISRHTDPAIKWNEPGDYHVTVLYADAVDPAVAAQFCADLQEIDVPTLALRIGQLNTFDNLGERALHFRIGRNADLLNYQAAVYEIAQDHGIICSPYSDPGQYKPHVTMGYLPDKTPRIPFDSKIKVTPQGVWCDHGDQTLWQSWAEESPDDPAPDDAPIKAEADTESDGKIKPIKNVPAAVYKEITVAVNKAFKGHTFVPTLLTEYTLTHIRALKGYGFTTPDVIEAAKWHYLGVSAAKALATTRSRFDAALVELFQKDIKKNVFISRMDVLLERYCRQAMVDGFADGGVEDIDLDDSTDEDMVSALAWLNDHISGQKQYVRNVAEVLFSDESLSDDEISQNKPELWWNKSIMPGYNYGLSRASGENALGIFELGSTEEHCIDCVALDGIAVTFKKWLKYFNGELPPCSATKCKGWRCKCRVRPYRGKKYRGTLPTLHGKAA